MLSRAHTLRGLAAFSLALLVASHAGAQLASKSPFMAPQAAGTPAPTTGASLEYRGMMQTAQGLKVRIVDPARRAGVWLTANEKDPNFDFVVKQIDVEKDTVTIDYQGRTMTVAQHVPKVASAGAPQMPVANMQNPASNMPPAIANSVVVNPTPADEQRRLEAVASEVARRRQLREQASQGGQGGAVAPQVVQPPQMQVEQQRPLPNPNQPNTTPRPQRPRGN